MDFITASILGLIQGLTEFLPVSSSGHLVIGQNLFGMKEPEIAFDVAVHLATLIAVVIFYRQAILDIIISSLNAFVKIIKSNQKISSVFSSETDAKILVLICISSVPTAAIGLLFKDFFKSLFASLTAVGVSLLITACILLITRFVKPGKIDESGLSVFKAILIGIVQGFAITPGVSRSGITISCALMLGLKREFAAKYSFLMSIPAILGAAILELKDITNLEQGELLSILAGVIIAAISGFLALKYLINIVNAGKLYLFSFYLLLLGTAVVIYGVQS